MEHLYDQSQPILIVSRVNGEPLWWAALDITKMTATLCAEGNVKTCKPGINQKEERY